MTNFVNLTPHSITVCGVDKKPIRTIEPSGYIARVKTERELVGEVDGLPIFMTRFGSVVIAGPYGAEVVTTDGIEAFRGPWIVSSMVRAAWVESSDLRSDDACVPEKRSETKPEELLDALV